MEIREFISDSPLVAAHLLPQHGACLSSVAVAQPIWRIPGVRFHACVRVHLRIAFRTRETAHPPCSGVAGRGVTTAAIVLFNSRVSVAVLGAAADLDEAWVSA